MLLGSVIKADFGKHGLARAKKPTLVMSQFR
jgi:hypothetical protein